MIALYLLNKQGAINQVSVELTLPFFLAQALPMPEKMVA